MRNRKQTELHRVLVLLKIEAEGQQSVACSQSLKADCHVCLGMRTGKLIRGSLGLDYFMTTGW